MFVVPKFEEPQYLHFVAILELQKVERLYFSYLHHAAEGLLYGFISLTRFAF